MAKKRKALSFLPINQHELLGFLFEMPPDSDDVLFNYYQRKYWGDLLARFSHYLGCFDGDRKIFQKWDKHYLEKINTHVMLYVSFYNVIFCAWENDIIPLAAQHKLNLSENAPLDCLKEIMFSNWELEEAKNRMKVKPTLMESYNLSLKITPSNLNEIEKSKHPKNRYDKLLASLWERLPENYSQIKGLEELCFYAARNSESPLVQKHFAQYLNDYREYGAILKKIAKRSTIKFS